MNVTIFGVPITGYCRVKGTDILLPMIETDTDVQWVESCIRSREYHPEDYPDEDIPAVIARSKELLAQLFEKEKEPPKPKSVAKGYRVIELVEAG